MRPFIQLTVRETKENVSSGTWIMENLHYKPAVVLSVQKGAANARESLTLMSLRHMDVNLKCFGAADIKVYFKCAQE